MSRLVNSQYGENGFSTALGNYDERAGYDGYGNITSLVRNGMMQNGNYGAIDSLAIDYIGTQIYSVTENAAPVLYTNSIDVKNGSDDILYNSNGALVNDGTRGITDITYDDYGNPRRIQFDNGNVTKYVYSATGQKMRAVYQTAVPNISVAMGSTRELAPSEILYADSTDYPLGGILTLRNGRIDKYLFNEGYCQAEIHDTTLDSITFYYYNKDHLGNNREVIDSDGNVRQRTDYYPYGTPFSAPSDGINATLQPYKYNGKELDMMHGLNTYDYGARQYYPVLPIWDRVDPLAEKYYPYSPYMYCLGNPVNVIDPDGKSTWVVNQGDGTYRVIGGDINDKDRNIYVYSQDKNGKYTVRGESIGITTSTTSFYDSDKGLWIKSIINPSDRSGANFLNTIVGLDVTLYDYMDKASF